MSSQSDHAADHQTPEQRAAEHDRPMTCCLCGGEYNYQHGWEVIEEGVVCEACSEKCVDAAEKALAEATTEAIRDLAYERFARQRDLAQQSPWWAQQDSEAPF